MAEEHVKEEERTEEEVDKELDDLFDKAASAALGDKAWEDEQPEEEGEDDAKAQGAQDAEDTGSGSDADDSGDEHVGDGDIPGTSQDQDDGGDEHGAEDDDPLEAIRKENEQLRQKLLTQTGRLSKVQREYNEIMRRMQGGGESGATKKLKEKVIDEEQGIFTDAWNELKEEYGDLGLDKIEDIITTQARAIRELEGRLQQAEQVFTQQTSQVQEQRQLEMLKQRHPDLDEVVRSEDFTNWLQTLPGDLQEVALTSKDADTVSLLLDQFKSSTGRYKSKPIVRDNVAESRKKRLQSSLGVSSKRSASPVSGKAGNSDFDALFDQTVQRILGGRRA